MSAKQKAPDASSRITTDPIPGWRRIYVDGTRYSDVRVPFGQVELTPTSTGSNGSSRLEPNAPVLLYDTSGPYTDPEVQIDVRSGLAPLRAAWIEARGDSEEYDGRTLRPEDDGYRTEEQLDQVERFPGLRRMPRRARDGANVSQMHYAKKGIITPEMEYIAIRENMGRYQLRETLERSAAEIERDDRLRGNPLGAILKDEITPEFCLLYTSPSPRD